MTHTNAVAVSAPDPSEVQRRVVDTIAQELGVEPGQIARDTRLFDLGDSLDRVETVMKLEEEFSIRIDDERVDAMLTVGDLVDDIVARVGAKGADGQAADGPPTGQG